MDAIGKVLRKTGAMEPSSHSAHKTTVYEKLAQEPSDEEIDDDVVFLQEGAVLHRNGYSSSNHNDIIASAIHSVDDATLVGLLQKGKVSAKRPAGTDCVEVKTTRWRCCRRLMGRHRVALCLLGILIGLATGLIAILVHLYGRRRMVRPSVEWTKEYAGHDTESCVRLVDVDGDGRLDVIFSIGRLLDTSISDLFKDNATRKSFENICQRRGETYPCLAELVALRGNDSVTLWTLRTHSWFFELNCGNIDINKDGHMDCIGTGRFGSIVAFDPRNGLILWQATSEFFVSTWSSFNVVILPDYTSDGVPELLVPHSSDPRFPAEMHDRPAGRLIMLDGATGKSIGRYIPIPASRETYMSPLLHTMADGSAYVIFGNGGETVTGSLLTISVPDVFRYVKQLDTKASVPHSVGSYDHWNFLPQTENPYIREIYRSSRAGVMVPPVCADVNNDGVKDLLMLAFDGNLTLFDGQRLTPLWTVEFAGMQSYSTPAPGYFNDDKTLDFMLHLNYGVYPHYNYSVTVVIDGRNGKTLWSMNSTMFEMSSDLVARTVEPYHDIFIFRVKGRLTLNSSVRAHRVKRQQDTVSERQPLQRRYRPSGYYGRKSLSRSTLQPGPGAAGRRRGSLADEFAYSGTRLGPLPDRRGDYDVPVYDDTSVGRKAYSDYGSRLYDYGDAGKGGQQQGQFVDSIAEDDLAASSQDVHSSVQSNILPSTAKLSTLPTTASMPASLHKSSVCASAETVIATQFAVDRGSSSTPLTLSQDIALPFYYNLTAEDLKRFEDRPKRRRRHEEHGESSGGASPLLTGEQMCTLMMAEERTTGALGDVDGDGTLDLVSIVTMTARITDPAGHYVRSKKFAKVSKLNLEFRLRKPALSTDPTQTVDLHSLSTRLRPYAQQPWASYLGTYGDSVYRSE